MTTRAAVQSPAEAELADAEVERILSLVDDGWMREARRAVTEAAERFPDHARTRQLAELLRPPTAHVHETGTRMDLRGQIAWLKAHAIEYPGQWLALREDKLLGAHSDLGLLEDRLDQNGGRDGVVLFYVPDREW